MLSTSKADAPTAAAAVFLDDPPADMDRDGAYDAKETKSKAAGCGGGGKFLTLVLCPSCQRSRTFIIGYGHKFSS